MFLFLCKDCERYNKKLKVSNLLYEIIFFYIYIYRKSFFTYVATRATFSSKRFARIGLKSKLIPPSVWLPDSISTNALTLFQSEATAPFINELRRVSPRRHRGKHRSKGISGVGRVKWWPTEK